MAKTLGRVEVYRVLDADFAPVQPERYGWRLIVKGRVIATDHGQGYSRRADAIDMATKITGGDYAGAQLVVLEA